jgi:hypothetical protein
MAGPGATSARPRAIRGPLNQKRRRVQGPCIPIAPTFPGTLIPAKTPSRETEFWRRRLAARFGVYGATKRAQPLFADQDGASEMPGKRRKNYVPRSFVSFTGLPGGVY